MNQINYKKLEDKYLVKAFKHDDVIMERGEGMYLYDVDGKKYLDFLSGIAVNALGYNYPKFTEALQKQVQTLLHCSNYFYIKPQLEVAKVLAEKSELKRCFFSNSGTESNEGAIKIARAYSYKKYSKKRNVILSFQNSFHGRTLGALAATGQPALQKGFLPNTHGFQYAEYNNIEDVKSKITEDTCAIMLELIQGEGGVVPATKEFAKEIETLCHEKDVVLIIDEVQTGVARTGSFTAYQAYGIKPDIATFAKGLGSGVPIGAIVVGEKCEHTIEPGMHGTTFGGNPFSTAAALSVLNTIEEDQIEQNVNEMSAYLIEKLQELKTRTNKIEDIRGKGLILGIVLKEDSKPIYQNLLKKGLIVSATAGNVLRLVPPLILKKSDIDRMIEILETEM